MIHDLLSFEAYFKTYKGLYGIETVIVGGYSDILALQNAKIRYPLLFVERPSERFNDDDTTQFQTRILVLTHGQHTDAKYRQNLNEMRSKVFQILKKMETEDSSSLFVFRKRGGHGDYKEAMTADLLQGYYAEINLKGVRVCS